MTRRRAPAAVLLTLASVACAIGARGPAHARTAGTRSFAAPPIDRHALVSRHDVRLQRFDAEVPLSVGNGEIAFTVDATGLQTFPRAFDTTTPLGTLSQWGWHSAPNPDRWSMETYRHPPYDARGRMVGYADIPGDVRTPEVRWLRANPHRLHLGRIGLRLMTRDGARARPEDLSGVDQVLDLWAGVIVSRFTFDGEPVTVRTLCHPSLDAIAVQVTSPLARDGRLSIEIQFPYGTGDVVTADWSRPEAHETTWASAGPGRGRFARALDADRYVVDAAWSPQSATMREAERHLFVLASDGRRDTLELTATFAPRDAPAVGQGFSPDHPLGVGQGVSTDHPLSVGQGVSPDHPVSVGQGFSPANAPSFADAQSATRDHWRHFWSTGGAIDLSLSRDPRWRELERRIVLSRYLTAIQCAGRLPPQETGLTYNSWEGKFHLEMHWWHAVHFAAWDRVDLLETSLGYYDRILPKARETAARQGYAGARWPKMTGPLGVESPSTIGPFLAWQQPHPIYYAELAYRAHPDRATLARHAAVVADSADFMASFAAWDAARERYTIGPPLQCAQERFPKETTSGCTFELTYWRWGLETAQVWRTRLGQPRHEGWDRVLSRLDTPLVVSGKYAFANSRPDSYDDPRWRTDHPTVLASLGMLPGPGVDRAVMRATLDWVWTHWDWPDTWGWDYPMVAMTAARLGDPARAIDALLLGTPKNHYGANGHNYQRRGLSIYLPGNGGLLAAVAMMAAGWDDAPDRHAPGFPDDGSWTVRWEGLKRLP